MIEVTIDSIRVSLMSQHRVVILKDAESDRYLPIWIGACEADAITIELQGVEVARPFTHDLLKSVINQLGAKIKSVLINDLHNEVFYAQVVLDVNGRRMEVDSRPSDALALAVRTDAPIFASTELIDENAIEFEREVDDTEEIIEGFRDFLEGVSPDDFRTAEVTADDEAFLIDHDADDDDDDDLDDEDDAGRA